MEKERNAKGLLRRALWTMLFMLFSVGVYAQDITVRGSVVDQNGEPVIGASVKAAGAKVGAVTNADGEFLIKCPANSQLEVSYVGFATQTVNASDNVSIVMSEDVNGLNEVVVTALGIKKDARKVGYAVSQVKAEDLVKTGAPNFASALYGKAAGVRVQAAPGGNVSAVSMTVRGLTSISGNTQPLIVLDGVPIRNGNTNNEGYWDNQRIRSNGLVDINPEDIENISILKGAAASALYGSEGNNGVVMITTKKGQRSADAKVTFDASWGVNSREVKNYDVITNTDTYFEQLYRTNYNDGLYTLGYDAAGAHAYANTVAPTATGYRIYTVPDGGDLFNVGGKINPKATLGYSDGTYFYTPDDWDKETFKNGMRQEYKASVSGGSDKLSYYFGAGYLNDEGVSTKSGFERISTRINVDYQLKPWLKLKANLNYANVKSKYPDDQTNSGSSGNAFYCAYILGPVYPFYVRNLDGTIKYNNGDRVYDYGDGSSTNYTRNTMSIANPIGDLTYQTEEYLMDIFNSRWGVDFTPVKGLTLSATLGINLDNTRYHYASSSIYGQSKAYGGTAVQQNMHKQAIMQQYTANYRNKFADAHSIDALFAYETYDYKYEVATAEGQNLYREGSWAVYNTIDQRRGSGSETSYALRSFIGRLNYDYKERYFASASLRADGSSRFHKDNRWGTFWAVGASWRLKEENFLKDVNWLNNLKLKISYGTQGNDHLLDDEGYDLIHVYSDLYSVNRVDGAAAFSKWLRGNSDVTWEKSRNFNVGVEAGFWKRLNVGFEFFIKETRDMLYQSPLAASEGKPNYVWRNEMNMKNTGIEIEISGDIIKTKDITWNAALNLTHYSNKLTKLPDSKPASEFPDGYQAGRYWRQLGGSLYDWYRYEYVGVDPTNGLPQYNKYNYKTDESGNYVRDDNGEPIVESIDIVNNASEATLRKTGKSAIPDLTGGFSTTLNAYGFDLSVSTAFQLGGWAWDYQYAELMNAGDNGQNFHKDMFNRWTPAHTDTDIPALSFGSQSSSIDSSSDYFLTKGSYFSLRNITVGYTFPKKWLAPAGISNLRVYLTGDNIWLVSKRKGFDPRYSFSGYNQYAGYSALSSYSVGVNLSF